MTVPVHALAAQLAQKISEGAAFDFFGDRNGHYLLGTGTPAPARPGQPYFIKAPFAPGRNQPVASGWTELAQGRLSPGQKPNLGQPSPAFLISEPQPRLSQAGYCQRIEHIQACMAQGDFYLMNFCVPFDFEIFSTGWEHLLTTYMKRAAGQYLSIFFSPPNLWAALTPELFLSWAPGTMTTEPIKGTVVPGGQLGQVADLLNSSKEQAEQLMVVDLLRNDLGRIAQFDSVHVDTYAGVMRLNNIEHTYSRISARPAPQFDWTETDDPQKLQMALSRLLPAGSVTGMPKKEVCAYLSNHEPGQRNFYTGLMGAANYTRKNEGQMALLIRAMDVNVETLLGTFGSGSGITYESNPREEYKELEWKVRSVLAPFYQTLNLAE